STVWQFRQPLLFAKSAFACAVPTINRADVATIPIQTAFILSLLYPLINFRKADLSYLISQTLSNCCKSEISGKHLTPWQTQALTALLVDTGLFRLGGSPTSSKGNANTRVQGEMHRNAFF